MALFALADRKGCSVAEIERWSASERNHWLAFYRLAEERRR